MYTCLSDQIFLFFCTNHQRQYFFSEFSFKVIITLKNSFILIPFFQYLHVAWCMIMLIPYKRLPYDRTNRSDCLRFWVDWDDSGGRMDITHVPGSTRMIEVLANWFIGWRLAYIPDNHPCLFNELYLKRSKSMVKLNSQRQCVLAYVSLDILVRGKCYQQSERFF